MPVAAVGSHGSARLLQCIDVWKQYYFHAHRPRKMRDLILQTLRLRPTPPGKQVWALQSFNLDLRAGQTVGIVGHNGAGKSTLLKLLSRIHPPTRGSIKINGRLSAIIELGAGFHEDGLASGQRVAAGLLAGSLDWRGAA